MRTERLKRLFADRGAWIEGGGLLAATPFLLFPTQFVMGTAVALLWVAGSWLWPLFRKRQSVFPASPFNAAFLLWGIMLVVGIGVTADPDLTLSKATGLILGLAVWRYVVRFIQNEWRLGLGFIGFVLLGLGFALLGVLGIDWTDKVPFIAPIVSRLPSQLVQIPEGPASGVGANQLAGAIEIHLIFLLSILIGWRPERKSHLVKTGIGLLWAGLAGLLLLTQSRSGWIGFGGGLLALLLLWGMVLPRSPQRRIVRFVILFVAVLSIVGIAWIGPAEIVNVWNDPAQDTVIGRLGTLNFRKEVWQWGITAVQDFPFTGTGLGTFRQVVRRLYPLNVPFDYDIAHAHNIFLQVALDVGLPGLIAYLAILFLAGVSAWQVARRDERLRPFALGLLGGLAALHIYDLTDAITPGSKPGLLFWVTLGLVAVMHRMTIWYNHFHDRD